MTKSKLPAVLDDPAKSAADAGDHQAFRLRDHLFYYFTQILAQRNRRLNVELKRFGLDFARWRVMAVLNEEPGCSMQQLADISSVDRTTLTHTLGLMEREGLVVRHERASDRRSVAVSLTPHGSRLLQDILPTVFEQTEQALAGFSQAEAETLRAQLARIAANLK